MYEGINEIQLGSVTSGTGHFGHSTSKLQSKVFFKHFGSLKELHDADVNPLCRSKLADIQSRTGYSWLGFNGGWEAMQKFVKSGWNHGYQMLMERGKRLLPEALEVAGAIAQRRRRKRVQGEYGSAVDMDRVWQGNLDTAWTQMRHETKISVSPKNVALFINLAASAGVGAEDLMWRSAVAVTLLDLLIKGGYSVSIDVGCAQVNAHADESGSGAGSEVSVFSVRIKDYGSQMSMQQLAAACSPGFFRTYLFKAIMSRKDKVARSSLGYPAGNNDQLIPWHLHQDRKAGARIVNIDSNVYNEKTAKTLVNSVLEQLKGEVVKNTQHR
jgi:hypothetical protein